jgi:DNA-binding PadR family transcriptional regulator
MPRQLSVAALAVLHAVARGVKHGFDIIDDTGLPGGTVYPALTRMERAGLLASDWEDVAAARAEGRPPRRNYGVTREGLAALEDALERVRLLGPIRRPNLARSGSGRR